MRKERGRKINKHSHGKRTICMYIHATIHVGNIIRNTSRKQAVRSYKGLKS